MSDRERATSKSQRRWPRAAIGAGLLLVLTVLWLREVSAPRATEALAQHAPRRDGAAESLSAPVPASSPPEPSHPVAEATASLLRGVVLDTVGAGVVGARLSFALRGTSGEDRGVISSAESDSRGDFVLRLPSGVTRGDLSVDHPEHLPLELPGIDPVADAPLTVTLRAPARIEGRILDAHGSGIGGASVQALRTAPDFATASSVSAARAAVLLTTTDQAGRFALERVESGRSILRVAADGHELAVREDLELVAGETTFVEITLVVGARISGRVLHPDGRPLQGAVVEARSDPAVEGISFFPDDAARTLSDVAGRYRLDGITRGAILLLARAPGGEEVSDRFELQTDSAERDLVLSAGARIRGRVIDEAGRPVANARVGLLPEPGSNAGPEAETATDGSFLLLGVEAGRYRVVAQADGLAETVEDEASSIGADEEREVTLVARRGGSAAGRVRGLDANALESASVTARAEGAALRTGVVTRDGRFRIDGLAPGRWSLVITLAQSGRLAHREIDVSGESLQDGIELAFDSGGTLFGSLRLEGRPAAGVRLLLHGFSTGDHVDTTTDHLGRFRFSGLPEGHVQLTAVELPDGFSFSRGYDLVGDREVTIDLRRKSRDAPPPAPPAPPTS